MRLALAGARVAVFDLEADKAERVAREMGGIGLRGDVTSVTDINHAMDKLMTWAGGVDILVNNAGIVGKASRLWELARSDMETVMAINLVGPFLWCKAVVPGMLQKKYGRIINIASIAGKEG